MQTAIGAKTILNLGSGNKSFADAINLDNTSRTNPDVVKDLDQTPWPFADNSFTEVRAYDVIEHLQDILKTMEEIHRVCRSGASVKITVPHFSSGNAFTDPTHLHFFSKFSMDYFTEGHPTAFYSPARFRVRAANIQFYPSLANRIIRRLANRWPQRYEQRWAWMFPAWFMFYDLEVVK
jgi:ubiquinone/menaquinone biosynthesis C-methylase UbiE